MICWLSLLPPSISCQSGSKKMVAEEAGNWCEESNAFSSLQSSGPRLDAFVKKAQRSTGAAGAAGSLVERCWRDSSNFNHGREPTDCLKGVFFFFKRRLSQQRARHVQPLVMIQLANVSPLMGMQAGTGGCHLPWRHLETYTLLLMW